MRAIRDDCSAAGVPFFFKQWGRFIPTDHIPERLKGAMGYRPGCVRFDGTWCDPDGLSDGAAEVVALPKLNQGPTMLDGVSHLALPETAHQFNLHRFLPA